MLILTRKPGESVYIGDNVKITIVEIKGHQIRVGIDAPRELRIYREEIYEQIREENRQAADNSGEAGLDTLSASWGLKSGGEKSSGMSKLSSMKVSSVSSPDVKSSEKIERPTKDGKESSPTVVRRRSKKRSE